MYIVPISTEGVKCMSTRLDT